MPTSNAYWCALVVVNHLVSEIRLNLLHVHFTRLAGANKQVDKPPDEANSTATQKEFEYAETYTSRHEPIESQPAKENTHDEHRRRVLELQLLEHHQAVVRHLRTPFLDDHSL